MILYLVRHAEAMPVGGGVFLDADRPLTPRGEEDAVMAGKFLVRVDPAVHAVVCSPLTRAMQTGRLLAGAFSTHPAVTPLDALLPGIRLAQMLPELAKVAGEGNIVAVGHQPDLTNFISFLVADAVADIAMPPAAIARLTIRLTGTHPEATLNWLVPPNLFHLIRTEP